MLYYSVDSAVKGSTERTTMSVLWTHGCNIAAAAAAGLTRRRGTSRQSRESGALKPAKLKRRRRNSSYRFHSPSYLESHHSPPPCHVLLWRIREIHTVEATKRGIREAIRHLGAATRWALTFPALFDAHSHFCVVHTSGSSMLPSTPIMPLEITSFFAFIFSNVHDETLDPLGISSDDNKRWWK